jgi:hypothetical protein
MYCLEVVLKKLCFKNVEKFAFSNGRQLSAFLKCTILNAKMQFYEIVNCVF